ncbi:MAG: 2-C-methyl-D-erythritol 4-phosphate cytidylyltransferase [Candidatus Aminicenantales bacterium]
MGRVTAIVAAAGEGRRFGAPKQFAPLRGKPVLEWCLDAFEAARSVDEIILVLADEALGGDLVKKYRKVSAVTRGGNTRHESVFAGLCRADEKETALVLVHDGARPLVTPGLIERVIRGAREKGNAIPVVPVPDTVKRVEAARVIRTEERKHLFQSQTPQGFSPSLLKKAFLQAEREGFFGTDEAALVERTGHPVYVVQGDPRNIKITTPEDIKIAEALLEL